MVSYSVVSGLVCSKAVVAYSVAVGVVGMKEPIDVYLQRYTRNYSVIVVQYTFK